MRTTEDRSRLAAHRLHLPDVDKDGNRFAAAKRFELDDRGFCEVLRDNVTLRNTGSCRSHPRPAAPTARGRPCDANPTWIQSVHLLNALATKSRATSSECHDQTVIAKRA